MGSEQNCFSVTILTAPPSRAVLISLGYEVKWTHFETLEMASFDLMTIIMSTSDNSGARLVPNSMMDVMPSMFVPSSAKNSLDLLWMADFKFRKHT